MNGFDISNHQAGLDLARIADPWDFAIMKATGGTGFVDKYCDGWVQQCKALGKRWGFYHFGDDGYGWNAVKEAEFFLKNCENYFGEGLPVFDWEEVGGVLTVPPEGVNTFVNYIHDRTDVWPWVYANPTKFSFGTIEPNCGRWIAAFPNVLRPRLDYKLPDIPETEGLVACWQYCSDGLVTGVEDFYLDLDRFFGDDAAWDAYVKGERVVSAPPVGEDGNDTGVSVLENELYRITVERK